MRRSLRSFLMVALGLVLAGCSLIPFPSPTSRSATHTPRPGPALTPSPVVTPTNTPVPIVRVSSGDEALFDGDLDTAMLEYRAAANDTVDPNIRQAALWGLARSQYAGGRYTDAVATLDRLVTAYPSSPYAAPAAFLKGQSLFALQRYAEAADAYQAYLTGRPGVLDSYVLELRGNALTQAAQYSDALTAYTAAQAAPHLDDAQALQIKIAETHASLKDYDTAISMYDTIAGNTTNDYIRAEMDYMAAQAYLSLNKDTEAYDRLKHAIQNYPLSSYSYMGLVQLLNANIAVDDLDRGLTDYFAGQYDVALTALDRYIAANPVNNGTALYYRAYTLEALQQYDKAVDAFSAFIANYPAHPKWVDAWEEKAYIQWYRLNQYPEAAQTLLDYVKTASTSSQAPDELMAAARIYERDGRFDDAAKTWQRVADEYPAYPNAPTAVFFAGIMQYRQADYNAALPIFEHDLVISTAPEDQARAYLWLGKTREKLGDQTGSQNAWQQGQIADPGGYYSLRASDLLMGRAPFAPPPKMDIQVDLPAERRAADAWVRLTFKLPPDANVSGLGSLEADPRLIRGRELWNLGLYEEARAEFEDLRCDLATQAGLNCQTLDKLATAAPLTPDVTSRLGVMTYQLSNFMLDLGLYRSGIYAARQLLSLAGLDTQAATMLAPPYFSHVRYGTYYSDLILSAAKQNGFDPLFLFSVVRQESLFEGFVSSTAGARGLMQIVPSTGASIADSLGWPIDYTPDKLYRPNVSIAYGAYYLASGRGSLGGDLYAALAAYNGGLGNALDWKKLGQGDPDLFLESVRFEETRQYIRGIYEIYVIYRRLYGPGS